MKADDTIEQSNLLGIDVYYIPPGGTDPVSLVVSFQSARLDSVS